MKIKDDVITVLANATVEGNSLRLNGQLDRKLYLNVNKVLTAIGGKWKSAAKAHIFQTDPNDIIQDIILTGEFTDAKKEYQFFPTPPKLAERVVDMALIREGDRVLEPSAGRGNIAKLIRGCDCIELMPENRQYLIDNGFNVVHDDFMTFESDDYDVIVANPPFCKCQDAEHISKMIHMAKRRVVAIGSAAILFRQDKKYQALRDLIEEFGGDITEVPDGAFKESGTNIRTVIVRVVK